MPSVLVNRTTRAIIVILVRKDITTFRIVYRASAITWALCRHCAKSTLAIVRVKVATQAERVTHAQMEITIFPLATSVLVT